MDQHTMMIEEPKTLSAKQNYMISRTQSLKNKFKNSCAFRKHMKLREEERKLMSDRTNLPLLRLDSGTPYKETALPNKWTIKLFSGIHHKTDLTSLSKDLQTHILLYLHPSEIIGKVACLSKYWHQLAKETKIWILLNNMSPLPIKYKYAQEKFIAQRRSKGFIFQARSRLTSQKFLVRRINLKKINSGYDDGIPSSILREIGYLRSLDHPNINKIRDVDVNAHTVDICSEYQEFNMREFMFWSAGKRASEHHIDYRLSKKESQFNAGGSISLPTIKKLGFQILQGISYLHHRGIFHRNLKPDNILITSNNIVKITDFSLSKLTSIPHISYTPEDPKDRERSGREIHRLCYRAPELLLRKPMYSYEVDIWAYGCLLAELALSVPLFNGLTEIEHLFQALSLTGNTGDENSIEETSSPLLPSWRSVFFPHITYPKDSPEYKKLATELLPNRELVFITLERLGNVLGYEGLEVLWNCLHFNPQKRWTADALLKHQFFDEVRQEMMLCYHPDASMYNHGIVQPQGTAYFKIPFESDCYLISSFYHMSQLEKNFRPPENFIASQKNITDAMRRVLVAWFVEVNMYFEHQEETLHLCINYLDRCLSKMQVTKANLQLVGITCMKVADAFFERSREHYQQENSKDYAEITADEYTAEQIVAMEKEILTLLSFDLNAPTALHFLKIYHSLLQVDDNVKALSKFFCDFILMSSSTNKYSASLLASTCLFLACLQLEYTLNSECVQKYKVFLAVHNKKDFERCLQTLSESWFDFKSTRFANFDAIYVKYMKNFGLDFSTIDFPSYNSQQIAAWICS